MTSVACRPRAERSVELASLVHELQCDRGNHRLGDAQRLELGAGVERRVVWYRTRTCCSPVGCPISTTAAAATPCPANHASPLRAISALSTLPAPEAVFRRVRRVRRSHRGRLGGARSSATERTTRRSGRAEGLARSGKELRLLRHHREPRTRSTIGTARTFGTPPLRREPSDSSGPTAATIDTNSTANTAARMMY